MGDDEGEERQAALKDAYQKRLQQMQAEQQKKELLRKMMANGAYERMMIVRYSNPELYEKVVSSLAYVAQSGRPMERIEEQQLIGLLRKMTQKKETTIEFKKK